MAAEILFLIETLEKRERRGDACVAPTYPSSSVTSTSAPPPYGGGEAYRLSGGQDTLHYDLRRRFRPVFGLNSPPQPLRCVFHRLRQGVADSLARFSAVSFLRGIGLAPTPNS